VEAPRRPIARGELERLLETYYAFGAEEDERGYMSRYQLHQDAELFEKAYGYVKQYY
jgi:hypothetical protein